MKGSYEEYKEKRKLLEEAYNKGIEKSRLKDAVDSVNAYLKNHEGSDVYFALECAKACCLIPNKDLVGNYAYEIRRKHVPHILAQKMTEFIVDNNWLDISEINCYDPNYTQFEAEMIVLVRHKPKETKSKFDYDTLEYCLMSAMKNDQRKNILKNMLLEATNSSNDESKGENENENE